MILSLIKDMQKACRHLHVLKRLFNFHEFSFRRMEQNDIKEAILCFTSHGLQESVSTLEAFYEYDPNAFHVAVSNTDSEYSHYY